MPGRVNLNLPPRLIESARAAQYANREALGSRELDAKIKAKARQRHAAAQRARPLPDDRVGGSLEFERRPMGRVRTRRRVAAEVDVGVAVRREAFSRNAAYTVTYLSPPYNNVYLTVRNGMQSTERNVTYGTQDGSRWSAVIPLERFSSVTSIQYNEGAAVNTFVTTSTSKWSSTEELTLPIGNRSMLVLFVTANATQVNTNYYGGFGTSPNTIEITEESYSIRAIQVTPDSVEEVSVGMPAYLLSLLPRPGSQVGIFNALTPYHNAVRFGFGWAHFSDALTTLSILIPNEQLTYENRRLMRNCATSNCYEGLTTFAGSSFTPNQVYLERYQTVTGNAAPALLNAQFYFAKPELYPGPDSNFSILGLPGSRIGTYGSSLNTPLGITPSLPLDMEDSVDHDKAALPPIPLPFLPYVATDSNPQDSGGAGFFGQFGLNFLDKTESLNYSTDGITLAYDMHGGTYCRDKLAELGISL